MAQLISTSQIEDQVLSAMLAAGITPPQEGLFIDGQLHRYYITGDKPGSKNGAYCIHPEGQSYNGHPNGFFQDHKAGDLVKWQYRMDNSERERTNQRSNAEAIQKALEKSVLNERSAEESEVKARKKASNAYENALPARHDHPYLVAKKVGVHGELRQSGGDLLVPLKDIFNDSLMTYQRIQPNGYKNFVAPFGASNAAFIIAGTGNDAPVILCEGLATGLSLHEALDSTIVCAMSCNNMVKIAPALRAKFKGRKIFVAADNDSATEQKTGKNPGVDAAQKAITAGLDGILCPQFSPENAEKLSDWNDFACLHGVDALAKEIARQMQVALLPAKDKSKLRKIQELTSKFNGYEVLQKELPPIRWAVQDIIPTGLGVLIGRPKIGKSSLMLGVALAIAAGGAALELIAAERGDVLYLALEDTERRVQQRIKLMGYGNADISAIDFVFSIPKQHEGGLLYIESWISQHPSARLIVIDTLQKFRKPQIGNGNIYAEDYETLGAVKQLADRYDLAVLFLHHERKSRDADDFINNASGSTGITGSADSLLFLNRARCQNMATLTITGRDVEEREHAISVEGMTWRLEGDAREFNVAAEKREILEYLQENGETSPKELAEILEMKPNTMRQKLLRMHREGLLYSNDGRYGFLKKE